MVPPPPVPSVEKASLDDEKIRIRWSDFGAGYTYHCQVGQDNEFKEVLVARKLAMSEIIIDRPEKHGKYFVRVSAVDDKGYEGEFSPPQVLEIPARFPYGLFGLLVPLGVILMLAL